MKIVYNPAQKAIFLYFHTQVVQFKSDLHRTNFDIYFPPISGAYEYTKTVINEEIP